MCPSWGSNPQPGYVPWPWIKSKVWPFSLWEDPSTHWATPAWAVLFYFLKDFIYLFLEGEKRKEKGKETSVWERNIDQLPCALAGQDDPETQACALTRNRTGNLSTCGTTPNRATWVRVEQEGSQKMSRSVAERSVAIYSRLQELQAVSVARAMIKNTPHLLYSYCTACWT